MGRGSTFFCRTCREIIRLGYGSAGTWLDDCRTLAEFDQRAEATGFGDRAKNVRMREALARHVDHDIGTYSEDWTQERAGKVYEEGPYGSEGPLLVDSNESWTHINDDDPITT